MEFRRVAAHSNGCVPERGAGGLAERYWADKIFALPPEQITPALAWLGVVTYTLQIYFDFSGYSDMAFGLGHLFGFKFLENFRYPYVARSITDFWRRWHISLSTWFRDYLYIPLGGNRGGQARTYANLMIVFLLCGLWHGASLTFVAWGAYHGLFLVLERVGLGAWLERRGAWLRHVYTMSVVMVGWVFFRADTFYEASRFLAAMVGIQDGSQPIDLGTTIVAANVLNPVGLFADARTWIAIAVGIVGSMPVLPAAAAWTKSRWDSDRNSKRSSPRRRAGICIATTGYSPRTPNCALPWRNERGRQ